VKKSILFAFALAFVLMAGSLHAQNQAVYGIVLNRNGQPVPGASIAILQQPANTSTQPGSPLANLCNSLIDVICSGNPNPVIADGLGNYFFYAPILSSGGYTYQFYGSGLTQRVEVDHGPSNSGVGVTVPPPSGSVIFNIGGVLATTPGIFNDAVGNFFHIPNGLQSDAIGGFRMNMNILSSTMPTSGSTTQTELGVCPAGTNMRQGELCVSEANGAIFGLATRGQLIGTDFSLDANGCTLFTANGNVNWCPSFNSGVAGIHNGTSGALWDVFSTFTSPSIYEALTMGWSANYDAGGSNDIIVTQHGGSGGSYRKLCFGTAGPTTPNGWCITTGGIFFSASGNPNPAIQGVSSLTVARIGMAIGSTAAPTCAFTSGGGTGSPTCLITGTGTTGSTDSGGTMLITTGTTAAATGTITLTFGSATGPDTVVCEYMSSQVGGTGPWTAPVTFTDTTPTAAADVFKWTNGANLSNTTTYAINYHCFGK
jgi:hypothetical protein